jgi:uncharacterized protein
MGLLTLLMIPAAWLIMWFPPLPQFFAADEVTGPWSIVGLGFGLFFGSCMLLFTSNSEAEESFNQQIRLIRSFRLNLFDTVFLSLCAGLGEEFLFRLALQQWLDPAIVAVIFVAIHGYIQPRDWSTTKYGLIVLAFILVLAYMVSYAGIWFCIFAHAAYDFVLMRYWTRYRSSM